ncbi:RNA polymerase subunit sigma-70, partial [Solicola sp. PLA-1-18]
IVSLLAEDAVWEMPPFDGWYRGAEQIGTLIKVNCPAQGPGDQVLVPVSANGQPCFGLYMRGEDGVHRAFQIQQLQLGEDGVEHVVVYFDLSLFERFGLPETLPADRVPRTA